MSIDPPPPRLDPLRPYGAIQDFAAADTWLICEVYTLNSGRVADPEVRRAELAERFAALQRERQRWFETLLAASPKPPSTPCSTPSSTSPLSGPS